MSDFTVTLYNLIQNGFDLELDEYDIFNEDYRDILNQAIINHYMFREIAYQNPAQWRFRLKERMSRIMRDKYNKLYMAKAIEFNPLYNIEITETFEHEIENKGASNETGKETNNSTDNTDNSGYGVIYPSEELTAGDINNPKFANNGNVQKNKATSKNENESTIESETKNNMVEKYKRFTEGSSAGLPFSKAMIQLKQYLDKYDLDKQVICELSDLFMTVYK